MKLYINTHIGKGVLLLATLIVMLGATPFVQVAQAQYKPIADPLIIQIGGELFQHNCASCHGEKAQGTVADWQVAGQDGKYPPPPSMVLPTHGITP